MVVVMLLAGWRLSLSDVRSHPSLVIWLCGCNLLCPFCHNWRIASSDPSTCLDVSIFRLVEEVERTRGFVDYVQVTGGEPLLQVKEVAAFLSEVKKMGLKASLNSNLTLPRELESVVELVDHVATDLKVPSYMYGVSNWSVVFERFLDSLRILVEKGKEIELRVPVTRVPTDGYVEALKRVEQVLEGYRNVYIVFRRIYGRPVVEPRSDEWCNAFCVRNEEEYRRREEELRSLVQRYIGSR
ncbi:MAG: anaerobic ribonucleoside-triphosphate reductase activating protein [Thermofilaceae archaeon]